jgi:hypothetical protein
VPLIQFLALAVPTTVSNGAATPVATLGPLTVSLESVGTATYQVQISNDPSATPASSSWINEGSPMSASGTLLITKPCAWVRVSCTAYTSGTPTGRIAGNR